MIVPEWLTALVAFLGLVGFIGFAFRQGMKVKPDRNPDNWQGQADGGGPFHGSNGHS
jgi:hypothetical protein